jgi:hypothetical protein
MVRSHQLLAWLMPGRVGKAIAFLQEVEEAYDAAPAREVPSLAREVLIAAIDPSTGKIWNDARYSVPAAVLLELAHEGRLDVTGTGRKTRLTLRDPAPLGDPELDDAMLTIGANLLGSKATRLVGCVPQTEELLRRLVKDGLVLEETRQRFGFTVRRYRPAPAAGRDAIVARVGAVLLGESIPDARTALLVASFVDVHAKLFVPRKRLREAYRRLPDIVAGLRDGERAIRSAVVHVMTNDGD